MKYFTLFLIITLWIFIQTCEAQEHVYMYQGQGSCHKVVATEHKSHHVPLWVLLFLSFLMSLLCLLFLGVLKGLIGLFICAPVGMWGIGALIDLPRPLECYQEPELAHRPVRYDTIGWPVHPDTGQRSVRAVTIKTEFYLNVIFFLAYPLAVTVTICSSFCFRESEEGDDECYKCVNTIVFADCGEANKAQSKTKKQPTEDIYDDEDSSEDKDTHYVVYQMHHSKQSLQNKDY